MFEDLGVGPSAGLRIIVEEWLALTRFPAVEFRHMPFGRRAAVRGGPEIWEIIRLWQSYETVAELHEHFGWLDRDAVDQAIQYYQDYPVAVNGILDEHSRVSYRESPNPPGLHRKAEE
jgi:uncharacterized protein (DUF433 family)